MNYRPLTRDEISLLHHIDRTETIQGMYYVREGQLVLEPEHHQVPDWSTANKEHRIAGLEQVFDQGATFFGAFDGETLAGMSVLEHNWVATGDQRLNLAGLWVSQPYRGQGVGKKLFLLAAQAARVRGALAMYVSATESEHTVHFYQRQGCRRADPVDPALFEKEPEDIHLELLLTDNAQTPMPNQPQFPRLATPRLKLRAYQERDVAGLLAITHDEAVMRYYGMAPFKDRAAALGEIAWADRLFSQGEGIRWVITLRDADRYIGDIGFNNYVRPHARAEIGFKLAQAHWHQGLMTEALQVVLAHGFTVMQFNRIEAVVDPQNIACISLLRKAGFTAEGLLREYEREEQGYVDLLMYSLLKREFQPPEKG